MRGSSRGASRGLRAPRRCRCGASAIAPSEHPREDADDRGEREPRHPRRPGDQVVEPVEGRQRGRASHSKKPFSGRGESVWKRSSASTSRASARGSIGERLGPPRHRRLEVAQPHLEVVAARAAQSAADVHRLAVDDVHARAARRARPGRRPPRRRGSGTRPRVTSVRLRDAGATRPPQPRGRARRPRRGRGSQPSGPARLLARRPLGRRVALVVVARRRRVVGGGASAAEVAARLGGGASRRSGSVGGGASPRAALRRQAAAGRPTAARRRRPPARRHAARRRRHPRRLARRAIVARRRLRRGPAGRRGPLLLRRRAASPAEAAASRAAAASTARRPSARACTGRRSDVRRRGGQARIGLDAEGLRHQLEVEALLAHALVEVQDRHDRGQVRIRQRVADRETHALREPVGEHALGRDELRDQRQRRAATIPPRIDTSSQPTSRSPSVAHQRCCVSPYERPSALNGPTFSNSIAGIDSDQATPSQISGIPHGIHATSANSEPDHRQHEDPRRTAASP